MTECYMYEPLGGREAKRNKKAPPKMEPMSRLRRRLVLFPLPFQGHINPMLQLASILHSKGGFSITIVHTRYNPPNASCYPHFMFRSVDVVLSQSEASLVNTNAIEVISLLNTRCAEPFRNSLSEMIAKGAAEKEESIACLIIDQLWYSCRRVADSFELPTFMLRTSSVVSSIAFSASPMLHEKGYLPIQEHHLEKEVPELSPLKFKDLPAVQWGNIDEHLRVLTIVTEELRGCNGLIFNSFHELEIENVPFASKLEGLATVPTFPIGPFHKLSPEPPSTLWVQDWSSISWLDQQAPKSVLYVSFGSLVKITEAELMDVAWALASTKQPFLWVVRPGLVDGSLDQTNPLPSWFFEVVGQRGHVVKWAPQVQVLAHQAIGGFWTHNGWNSTLESICEGVPMICLPYFADQMVNARCVSDVWKVGILLENGLKREDIEKAIRRLMMEKEGEKMRERIACLKKKANHCLVEGGSSYKSLENLVNLILSY